MSRDDGAVVSRRRFIELLTGGLAIATVGARLWVPTVWGQSPPGSQTDRRITRVSHPYNAETPVETFTSWTTPTKQFFVRSHFGPPSTDRIDPRHWHLRVAGLVDRPLELNLSDLKHFDEVNLTAVVQCSGNGRAFFRPRAGGVQWQKGAVGNARWTGVRLRDVLTQAGLRPTAKHLHLLGADRPVDSRTPLFLRSIPLEKALHPDTVLAYGMNGEPLPVLHGAPLRLIAPGWMADACIKWLTDLTISDEEAKGYFMETAYRSPVRPVQPGETVPPEEMQPVTEMGVKSLIVGPTDGAAIAAGSALVQGVAWTGEGRIVRVEVSTDGGATWSNARLLGEETPYAWRFWEYEWRAMRAGMSTLLCRATDDRGQRQPEESPWNPGGYLWNGWDRVTVTVTGD